MFEYTTKKLFTDKDFGRSAKVLNLLESGVFIFSLPYLLKIFEYHDFVILVVPLLPRATFVSHGTFVSRITFNQKRNGILPYK